MCCGLLTHLCLLKEMWQLLGGPPPFSGQATRDFERIWPIRQLRFWNWEGECQIDAILSSFPRVVNADLQISDFGHFLFIVQFQRNCLVSGSSVFLSHPRRTFSKDHTDRFLPYTSSTAEGGGGSFKDRTL